MVVLLLCVQFKKLTFKYKINKYKQESIRKYYSLRRELNHGDVIESH